MPARRRALWIMTRRESSCDIQRMWRGWIARSTYLRYKKRKYAAIVIQKWTRREMRIRHSAARTLQFWLWRVLASHCSRAYQIRQRQIDFKTISLVLEAQKV